MKPRLLICIDWFEPAYKAGGPIRSVLNMIQFVLEEYDVYVLTSDHDLGEDQPLQNIKSNIWLEHNCGAKVCYLSKEKRNFKNILTQIKKVEPSRLYLNSQFSKIFTIYPLIVNRYFLKIEKVILAPRGMLRDLAMRSKMFKKSLFNTLMRGALLAPNIVFQSTDEQEHLDILQKMKVAGEQVVKAGNVPVIVREEDTEHIAFPVSKFILVSRLAPHKNIDLLLSSLLPITKPLSLTLVGAYSDEKYRAHCQHIIDGLPKHITVHQLGAKSPVEIPNLLASHHIFVLPTRGENFGHSIFEAFASSLPVIVGRNVPWTDIEKKKVGWLIDESSKDELTNCINECLKLEEHEYREMSDNALNYARAYWEHTDFEQQYDALFS